MKTRCHQTIKIYGRKRSYELVVSCDGLTLTHWDVRR